MLTCGDDGPRYTPPPRCTRCGHRAAAPGEPWRPERTRDLPWWFWPLELAARLDARMRARHGPPAGGTTR